ncbi:MAG: endolytic transglycosylase MltG [Nitrospinota bacterium]
MRRGRVLGALLLVFLLLAGGVLYLRYLWQSPASQDAEPRLVTIPSGSSLRQIAAILERERIIRAPALFRWLAYYRGVDRSLKAGEYRLSARMSPEEILRELSEGHVVEHSVTIPEGSDIRAIARTLEDRGMARAEEVMELAFSLAFARSLGVEASSLEGYLFPDTYRFPKGVEAGRILAKMVSTLKRAYTPAMAERAKALGLSRHEVLTLASLIEKETSLDKERPLVSAVYHNRLRRGMRLQSDPTVIYAIEDFDGNLTKEHLAIDSPYNTYLYPGLPPGPITNPGLSSIRAALYPARVDYLYFVSRKDGSHHFSRTLAEHNAAVARYQLGGRKREAKRPKKP